MSVFLGSIHVWLQEKISKEAYKLAESITLLQKENPIFLNEIKNIFWNKGKEISKTAVIETAMDIYKMMNDSLLDGMPCFAIREDVK